MYCVEFTKIDGQIKRKYFKTFKSAKNHYDSYKTKSHFWFNIAMGELKKELEPKNVLIKEEWIN
jgi:hypothetical protein